MVLPAAMGAFFSCVYFQYYTIHSQFLSQSQSFPLSVLKTLFRGQLLPLCTLTLCFPVFADVYASIISFLEFPFVGKFVINGLTLRIEEKAR
jgi:hypothetical protein